MLKQTPLYPQHRALGAKMAPFAGWEMPLHYGSQIREHHAVRRGAGMFDVSHMQILDLSGPDAEGFLRRLLANDVGRLSTPGRALYSCMLNQRGGVIDDLIVYFLGDDAYRLVVNAATAAKDRDWLLHQRHGFDVKLEAASKLALLAVQGPQAADRLAPLLPSGLRQVLDAKPFSACADDQGWMAARTGYTGEDGFELMLPETAAPALWDALAAAGVTPCGLGARDTLRLEAGLNLYGHDMDEETSPLESGLAWTIAWAPEERDFVGRAALEAQRQAGPLRRFRGLVLEGRGVLRDGQTVWGPNGAVGRITSGGFSPTLNTAIALARLEPQAGESLEVEIRGKRAAVRAVQPPFVRHGKPQGAL